MNFPVERKPERISIYSQRVYFLIQLVYLKIWAKTMYISSSLASNCSVSFELTLNMFSLFFPVLRVEIFADKKRNVDFHAFKTLLYSLRQSINYLIFSVTEILIVSTFLYSPFTEPCEILHSKYISLLIWISFKYKLKLGFLSQICADTVL